MIIERLIRSIRLWSKDEKRGKTNSFIQSAGQERLLFRRTATPDDEDGKWVSAAPVDVLSRPLSGFVSAISAAFSASRHVVGQNSRAATHTHTETACVCVCVCPGHAAMPAISYFIAGKRIYSPFLFCDKGEVVGRWWPQRNALRWGAHRCRFHLNNVALCVS